MTDPEVKRNTYKTVRGNPKIIGSLIDRGRAKRAAKQALKVLRDELFHQGWRPSAAKPAIVELADTVYAVVPEAQAELLELLRLLAIGFDVADLRYSLRGSVLAVEKPLTSCENACAEEYNCQFP